MASVTQAETTLRFLLARVGWPVRMVRWVAAREYGAILSSKAHQKKAVAVYLDWLRTRTFESQVVAGLAVLLCTDDDKLPSFEDVCASIQQPSILADLLLQQIYGYGNQKGGWLTAHSGVAPNDFVAEKYFDTHKTSDVPMIHRNHMERLEERFGFPFMRQWGFEWRELMDKNNTYYSDFPYYFVGNLMRSNVVGQFDLAQSDVFRSAYLRTLACAVSTRIFNAQTASFYAMDCLPLNRDLLRLKPIERPKWLADIPERCCVPDASLEAEARKLVAERADNPGMRPVSLHIPLEASLHEFSDLTISAIMATDNFVPDETDERYFSRETLWPLPDALSFRGEMEQKDASKYVSNGRAGACLPLCLNVVPLPFGYWHADYLQLGLPLPAPYNFPVPPEVECEERAIKLYSDGDSAATFSVWHDRWTPLYAKGGDTRCGGITEMGLAVLSETLRKHDMRLGWVVQLRLLTRPDRHGEYQPNITRIFFFD